VRSIGDTVTFMILVACFCGKFFEFRYPLPVAAIMTILLDGQYVANGFSCQSRAEVAFL